MFVKHFVGFNTRDGLDDYDVIEYLDIVQSVVPSKIIKDVSVEDSEKVSNRCIYIGDALTDPIYIHKNNTRMG